MTSLEWTNPHAWVFMDTLNEQGTSESWVIELLGINTLMRSGMTPKNIKAGDVLVVIGYGSRDGTNTANASSVTNVKLGTQRTIIVKVLRPQGGVRFLSLLIKPQFSLA